MRNINIEEIVNMGKEDLLASLKNRQDPLIYDLSPSDVCTILQETQITQKDLEDVQRYINNNFTEHYQFTVRSVINAGVLQYEDAEKAKYEDIVEKAIDKIAGNKEKSEWKDNLKNEIMKDETFRTYKYPVSKESIVECISRHVSRELNSVMKEVNEILNNSTKKETRNDELSR